MPTCKKCPLRDTCTTVCADIEQQRPSPERARLVPEQRGNSQERLRALAAEMMTVRLMLEHRRWLRGELRRVFDLTYNNGFSQDEIARRMKIHPRKVSRLLERARRKIAGRI
jgi:DNA-directed RNA polymerase specialized sigma24 family protein